MRALVTGASGHVGSFVARELLARGDSVVALARPSSDLWRLRDPFLGDVSAQIETLRADFDDAAQLREAVVRARPDCVVHLAWEGITAERRDDPSQVTRNAIRSLELLEAAHSVGCGAFVGVGSQAEYGPRTDWHFGVARDENGSSNEQARVLSDERAQSPLSESARGAAHEQAQRAADEQARALLDEGEVSGFSAYGVSKLCVGLLQQKFCELAGMRGVWLRLLATYGPQDDERHLIPSVIEQLLRGEKPALSGGEQRWDYLYVADAARAIAQAGHNPGARGVFDLGSGEAPTVRQWVERARDLVDPALPLGFGELPPRAGQIMHLQADLTALRRQLDWEPSTHWQKGLNQTVTWHREKHRTL